MAGMTFEDLPPDLRLVPLTDPRIAADVIDLIISLEHRAHGALGLMVCDRRHRGTLPVVIPDLRHDADVGAVATVYDCLLPVVAERGGSVVVGRGRPFGGSVNDIDRAWHQQTIDSCRRHGVRLLGFHLATRDGVVRLPEPLAEVS